MATRASRLFQDHEDLDEVQVGDVVIVLGNRYVITRIEPYTHPAVTSGERWCIAYEDRDNGRQWGITITNDRPLRHAERSE